MKSLVALLVFLLCSAVGWRKAQHLKKRQRTIEMLIREFSSLETLIEYRNMKLAEALKTIGQSAENGLWENMLEALDAGSRPEEAWAKAIEAARAGESGFSALKQEELCAMNDFVAVFGTTDRKRQHQFFEEFRDKMESILDSAKEQNEKQGKLYRQIGVLSGVALGLFVI